MKTSEVSKLAEKVASKEVLELIDIKIENDMKEVINKIESSERNYLNKIELFQNKIEQFQNQNQSEFKRLEDKIGMILWALGIIITLIIAIKFFAI
jgi:hypothetical protein